jgi:hypothetical protein
MHVINVINSVVLKIYPVLLKKKEQYRANSAQGCKARHGTSK